MSEQRISSGAGPNHTAVSSSPPRTSVRPAASPRWRDIQFVEFDAAPEPPLQPEFSQPEPPRPELSQTDSPPEFVAPIPMPPIPMPAIPMPAIPMPPIPMPPIPMPAVAVVPLRIPANSNEPVPDPVPVGGKPAPTAAPEPVFTAETPFPPLPRFPPEPVAAEASAPRPRAPRYGRAIAPLPPHLIASVKPPPRESLPPAKVRLRPAAAAAGTPAVLQGTPFGPHRGGRRWRGAVVGLICVAGALIISRSDLVANLAERIGTPPHGNSAAAAPAAIREPPVLPVAVAPPQAPAVPQPAGPEPAATAPSAVAGGSAVSAPASDRLTDLTIRAKAGDTGAQYDLGVIFARGDGVPQDYAKAAGWFREAAINGNVPAQYNLAVLYEHGLGVAQNMNEALIWYHSAAARNYASAQYNLAISYAQGHGTPQDMVAAARWYLHAAQQGVVAAMVNFAILCEGGQGTDKSPAMAYAWYRAAGARGDAVAAKRADELYRLFSEDGKKAAEMASGTAEDSIHETLLPPAPGKSAAATPHQTPG